MISALLRTDNGEEKEIRTASYYWCLVAIGAGAGLIGSGDSVMNRWFDQTKPTAEQSIQQGHCGTIYDNWTQLELSGNDDAANALLPKVQECNANNSGAESANTSVEVKQ